MKRFVILDRDGTINREVHYLSKTWQVELCPGAGEGLRQMKNMGLGLAVVTNQSGLARGLFSEKDLVAIQKRFDQLLADYGVALDGFYYCPHKPNENCACRKPLPGMIEKAAVELKFKPSEAFVIGDKPCDIELGQRVGATTILVLTGYGKDYTNASELAPNHVVDDLLGAAEVIRSQLPVSAERPTCKKTIE